MPIRHSLCAPPADLRPPHAARSAAGSAAGSATGSATDSAASSAANSAARVSKRLVAHSAAYVAALVAALLGLALAAAPPAVAAGAGAFGDGGPAGPVGPGPAPAAASVEPEALSGHSSRPLPALDACARALQAEHDGDRRESVASWESAVALDPQSISPRLALARQLLFTDPARAGKALRPIPGIVLRDFRASRWSVANGMLGLALAGTLGALLLLAGLFARHARALFHLLVETVGWSLRAGRAAPWLAAVLLGLPVVAGWGISGALLFWVFAASFRFRGRERMVALGSGAWLLLIGPALEASRPLWASDPTGRDALLVYETQRDPTAGPSRRAVETWMAAEPDGATPLFLDGLRLLRLGRAEPAEAAFAQAAGTGSLPPAVLESNLGTARAARGDLRGAVEHYVRAAAHDPRLFEPQYNLGLVLALQGRYPEADAAMDRAAAADLDRLRALGRELHREGPRAPVSAQLSSSDLWSWGLGRASSGSPPELLLRLFPLRSLLWSTPVLLAALAAGWLLAPRLQRLLAVRVCYQCGRPICRRCAKRVDRHAYCPRCAESLVAAGYGESTRLLIRRLLEEEPSVGARLLPAASLLLPGAGATAQGYPAPGVLGAVFAGLGLALVSWRWWAQPALPLPWDLSAARFAGLLGAACLAAAVLVNALGVRAARHREGSLRAFFERDVDRRAA